MELPWPEAYLSGHWGPSHAPPAGYTFPGLTPKPPRPAGLENEPTPPIKSPRKLVRPPTPFPTSILQKCVPLENDKRKPNGKLKVKSIWKKFLDLPDSPMPSLAEEKGASKSDIAQEKVDLVDETTCNDEFADQESSELEFTVTDDEDDSCLLKAKPAASEKIVVQDKSAAGENIVKDKSVAREWLIVKDKPTASKKVIIQEDGVTLQWGPKVDGTPSKYPDGTTSECLPASDQQWWPEEKFCEAFYVSGGTCEAVQDAKNIAQNVRTMRYRGKDQGSLPCPTPDREMRPISVVGHEKIELLPPIEDSEVDMLAAGAPPDLKPNQTTSFNYLCKVAVGQSIPLAERCFIMNETTGVDVMAFHDHGASDTMITSRIAKYFPIRRVMKGHKIEAWDGSVTREDINVREIMMPLNGCYYRVEAL